jgi:CHAD domain-containing protein
MDVLTSHAVSVASKTSEQECLVELLEHLGAKRAGYAKNLRKAAKNNGSRLRSDLATIAKKVDNAANSSDRDGEPKIESSGQQRASLRQLMSDLDNPPRLNRGNLHPYRLKVKELRYVLQLAEDERSQAFVKNLGGVEDAIGEWHDWEELLALATEVLNSKPKQEFVRQLKKITDEKFEAALSITNQMRRRFGEDKREKLLPC